MKPGRENLFVPELISKKRDGKSLTQAEIDFLVRGYVRGEIPDYQLAAWAMAVYFRGLALNETLALTQALLNSGEKLDLSAVLGFKVDKHSTGGVGDKTTLVLAPLLAAAGLKVPKLSGRGLGHTGGTIDKLEAIPGFRVHLSQREFLTNLARVGVVIGAATENLVPGDKKLYALRDVTATVDCPPLIASSIMAKKLAGGADAFVLDVKAGKGAFLKNEGEASALAKLLVAIGQGAKKPTTALVTRMAEPLGFAVGNTLEVEEALAALEGRGPAELIELVLNLGAEALRLAGEEKDLEAGKAKLALLLQKGKAKEKFEALVAAQGGNPRVVENPSLLPRAAVVKTVKAGVEGYVCALDALQIGRAAVALGAGRAKIGDQIDLGVGIVLRKKMGDFAEEGEVIAEVHARNPQEAEAISLEVAKAFCFSFEPVPLPPLIFAVFRSEEYGNQGRRTD